jgi:hypothetical protein
LGSSAAFTIVQNEPTFLPLWLRYYTRHFAPHDVYVLDHDGNDGSAQEARRRFGIQLVPVHRHRSFDHHWLCQTVCRFQAFLLQSYRTVLFAEIDEFVVADPRSFRGLDDYAEALATPYARCVGLNVLHLHESESALDFARPILAQRSTCYRSGMYCKALLAREPLAWEPGFHTARGVDAPPDERLYLIHLHRADYATCLRRHQAAARRRWNEADLREGKGAQNRVCDPDEFRRWFYGGPDLGEARQEIPAHLRDAF